MARHDGATPDKSVYYGRHLAGKVDKAYEAVSLSEWQTRLVDALQGVLAPRTP